MTESLVAPEDQRHVARGSPMREDHDVRRLETMFRLQELQFYQISFEKIFRPWNKCDLHVQLIQPRQPSRYETYPLCWMFTGLTRWRPGVTDINNRRYQSFMPSAPVFSTPPSTTPGRFPISRDQGTMSRIRFRMREAMM